MASLIVYESEIAQQSSGNGLGDSFLTALHMVVGGAVLITGAAQIILKGALNVSLNVRLAIPRPSKIDCRCRSLSALDSLGMVVSDLGGQLGSVEDAVQAME